MKLKIGTFASSGSAKFFGGIARFLLGLDSGKLWAYQDSSEYGIVNTNEFGKSDVNDVAYINNEWWAGANNGTVAKSTNGASWSAVNINNNTNISVMNYGGSPLISTDLSTWTSVASNIGGNTNVTTMYYANGIWVAGGDGALGGNTTGGMRISTNGLIWTMGPTIFDGLYAIKYNNGLWVGAGGQTNIFKSQYLQYGWTLVTSNMTSLIQEIAYGNGLWVAVGNSGQIRRSTDATTWTTVNSNFGTTLIYSIAYGNGTWVICGNAGQMRSSTDAITWTTVTSNVTTTTPLNAIAYANGQWVVTGSETRYSTDAITWITVSSTPTGNSNSVIYGHDGWYRVGSNQIFKSTDATNWTTVVNNYSPNATVYSIAYGNGMYAVGNSRSIGVSRITNENFTSYFVGAE